MKAKGLLLVVMTLLLNVNPAVAKPDQSATDFKVTVYRSYDGGDEVIAHVYHVVNPGCFSCGNFALDGPGLDMDYVRTENTFQAGPYNLSQLRSVLNNKQARANKPGAKKQGKKDLYFICPSCAELWKVRNKRSITY